ncbi:hypothetical protein GCM10027514_20910 [Azotobacter armeniacus]
MHLADLIRMGLADAFDQDEPAKQIARRLMKAGIVEYVNNYKREIFTLARRSNGDCLYLKSRTRL